MSSGATLGVSALLWQAGACSFVLCLDRSWPALVGVIDDLAVWGALLGDSVHVSVLHFTAAEALGD